MKVTWTVVYFAGMIAQIVIRAPFDRLQRGRAKTDRRVSGVEQALIGLMTVAMLLLPALAGFSPWLDGLNYGLSEPVGLALGVLGVFVLGASLWVFWRAHVDLGANWSPSLEIGDGHTLVTHGIYAAIRHPMYASQALGALAQALLIQNWLAGPAALLVFLGLYLVRVPLEERMMADHFGERYADYCAQTGRILPRLGRRA